MKKMEKGQYAMSNGKTAVFNYLELRSAITHKAQTQGISRQELMENIADEIGISFSSMKHWIQGHNAPSDLDKVQDIANALGLSLEDLLTEKGEEEMTTSNNTSNVAPVTAMHTFTSDSEAVRSIYILIVDFIETFRQFASTQFDKTQALKNIFVCLMKARLDIPSEVFIQLLSFVVNYLQQMILADKLFTSVYAEEMNDDIAPNKLYEDFVGAGSLITAFCGEPWLEDRGIDLSLLYSPNILSEDAQIATKAIGADWLALENADPFIPIFYFENTINYAYMRLSTILAQYQTA